jgi:hypothetical protein
MRITHSPGRIAVFTLASLLLPVVNADHEPIASLSLPLVNCYAACERALALTTFSDIPKKSSEYAGKCHSKLYTTSLAACLARYCSAQEIDIGWQEFGSECWDEGDQAVVPSWVLASEQGARAWRNVSALDFRQMTGQKMNSTVVPSTDLFGISLRTVVSEP